MRDDRQNNKQLSLNFESEVPQLITPEVKSSTWIQRDNSQYLSLVVSNRSISSEVFSQELKPNSPEITQIIKSIGKTLNW